MPNNDTPQDWGYLLTGRVSENLIRRLEGEEALNNYSENWQLHERAKELILALVGVEPCLFYIHRFNIDPHDNQREIWNLTLATDQHGFCLPDRLNEFDKISDKAKTLQIWATAYQNNNGCLGIYKILFVDVEEGNKNAFSIPFYINLRPNNTVNIGIPKEGFAIIKNQPFCREYVPAETQRRLWGEFLNIETILIERKQFCVEFSSQDFPNGTNYIINFLIDETFAFGINSNHLGNRLTTEDLWERLQQARNENIQLLTDINQVNIRRSGRDLGKIERIRREAERIIVSVQLNSVLIQDIERGEYTLPEEGYLLFKDVGSIAQIECKRRALKNLETGHTQNINLGRFLFDATQAKSIQQILLNQNDLLLQDANEGQKAAVEAVLGSEDLVLLQGPPGTGKTTVIAELCYQIALRGGKTLVVSQANLAVDNALERLPHHPLLRPLRAGNTIHSDGQSFLEHRVVDRWRENTAKDCENQLQPKINIVQGLLPLLTNLDRFTAYIEIEKTFPTKQQELYQIQTNLELDHQSKLAKFKQIEDKYQEVEQLLTGLTKLVGSNAILQLNQEQKLDKLRSERDAIHLAKEQLEQWSVTASSQIYNILKQCLQQRQYLTEDLIALPSHLLSIVNDNLSNWAKCIDDHKREINVLINSFHKWDRVCEVANKINWLLSHNIIVVEQTSINESYITQFTEKIKDEINNQDSFSAINDLYQLARIKILRFRSLEDKQKPLVAAVLEAIRREKEFIIQESQPSSQESILQNITVKIANDLFKKVKLLLTRLEQETEQKITDYNNNQENLETILEPFTVIPSTQRYLEFQLLQIQDTVNQLTQEIKSLVENIDSIKHEIQILEEGLNTERDWWCNIWKNIPEDLKPNRDFTLLFHLDFLNSVPNYFDLWQKNLTETELWLNRYQKNIEKWIERLRNPSEKDLETFKKKYLDNVNVVGITCVKAGNWNFSQKYRSFDVVIIDEVSKCTPPELLIPAIKGKKVVMIGDYRQLPPILDEENLDELAERIDTPREKLAFLEESWFYRQFESARERGINITKKLTIQYRMHPQIMEAINQFYDEGDGGLTCGLSEPDKQRAHHFNTQAIKENNHIIWVKMPLNTQYTEHRQGTSFYNDKEIECIKNLCQQMNNDWANKVAEGKPQKEIGIITFYGAQLGKIMAQITNQNFPNLNIRTGTVDEFQGMEKSVIIVSMVRNNYHNNIGFARTPERVNVAFSRAKELLIILGCHDLFTSNVIYSEVSKVVARYQGFVDENLCRQEP